MPIIRPLRNPASSLLARFAGRPGRPGMVDKIRQIATNLGARPYRVHLIWVRWTGMNRGEGKEELLAELEILPTPVVTDLTAVNRNPFSAGTLPVGSISVSEISAGQYSEDMLRGWKKPDGQRLDEQREDFWWEVREDGRTAGRVPERRRFRLMGDVFLNAENVEFRCVLERASPDLEERDGFDAVPFGNADHRAR